MSLEQELPTLLVKVAGLDKDVDPLQWWKNHSNDLPYWSAAAKKNLTCAAISAVAKRGFSLLQNSFGSYKDASLAGYVQASLLPQYNKRTITHKGKL